MLQKFIKSSVGSTPINLPSPPTVDCMLADLAHVRPNDPLLQIAPIDCFLAYLGEKSTSDGISSDRGDTIRKLSKLSFLCDKSRDAGEFLEDKRTQLKSLIQRAIEKRDELEGIISWSIEEKSVESSEEPDGTGVKMK